MPQYQQLSTQKYVDVVQKQELKQLRRAMAARTIKSLMLFLFSIAVFLLAMYSVFQMPNWMPAVQTWLEQVGILTSQAS